MKQQGNVLIILVVVATLVVGLITYYNYNRPIIQYQPSLIPQPIATNSAVQTRTFKSSNVLKFSIELPAGYNAEEKLGSVTVSNNVDSIIIGQNGTNFDNLNDYIKNSKNNLERRITNRKDININGLESVSGSIDKEKTYFIYVDNNVYLLATKNPLLYLDLDQIAKSFRYTP